MLRDVFGGVKGNGTLLGTRENSEVTFVEDLAKLALPGFVRSLRGSQLQLIIIRAALGTLGKKRNMEEIGKANTTQLE